MITPDMLINRHPTKPLSPFKVRRRGAKAFWRTVASHYGKTRHSGHEKKTDANRASEQITGAFIKGWKDNWHGVEITADVWRSRFAKWTDVEADVGHLREAYISGYAFYAEQFPAERLAA